MVKGQIEKHEGVISRVRKYTDVQFFEGLPDAGRREWQLTTGLLDGDLGERNRAQFKNVARGL
jgi:hypothetical protein